MKQMMQKKRWREVLGQKEKLDESREGGTYDEFGRTRGQFHWLCISSL